MTCREEARILSEALDRLETGRAKNKAVGVSARSEANRKKRIAREKAVARQMKWRARHPRTYCRYMRNLYRKRKKMRSQGNSLLNHVKSTEALTINAPVPV